MPLVGSMIFIVPGNVPLPGRGTIRRPHAETTLRVGMGSRRLRLSPLAGPREFDYNQISQTISHILILLDRIVGSE